MRAFGESEMPELTVVTYRGVRDQIGSTRCHMLLGNGFSIACNPIFRYERLYDNAVAALVSVHSEYLHD